MVIKPNGKECMHLCEEQKSGLHKEKRRDCYS